MGEKDNFETDEKQSLVLVSVNPKIFSLPVIFSAAYWMMDKAFVVIDGSPETQVVVSLRPRKNQKLEELARLFNDELLNYAVNAEETKKTESLRNELIKQAFAGHSGK